MHLSKVTVNCSSLSVSYHVFHGPDLLLMLKVHGNAGTVAQGWRPDTYRALAPGDSPRVHVLAFDYRGFGHSSGSPTEQGLILDGIAVVDWVIRTAGVLPNRIVLVGQSLGTAVATAVAEHFVKHHATEFAGLVLVAGFAELPKLLTTYAIGGLVPILAPLKPYPKLQRFFASQVLDRWPTASRLASLIQSSAQADLTIIHALDDWEIACTHSDLLFYAAANATSSTGLSLDQVDRSKQHEELGEAGYSNSWVSESSTGGLWRIKQIVTRHGGADDIRRLWSAILKQGRTQPYHDSVIRGNGSFKLLQACHGSGGTPLKAGANAESMSALQY